MIAIPSADVLMILVREWFPHRQDAIARLGDVAGREVEAVLDRANALLRGEERLLQLNARYDIGSGAMNSWLLFGKPEESDRDYIMYAYAVLGTLDSVPYYGPFVKDEPHPTDGTWHTHLKTAVLDLPAGPVPAALIQAAIAAGTSRTLAALTISINDVRSERVILHAHSAFDARQAAAFLRHAAVTHHRDSPTGGAQ